MGFFQKIIDIARGKDEYLQIHGAGNEVVRNKKSKAKIIIYGKNNKVLIDESIKRFPCTVYIGAPDSPTDGCTVTVKKGCTSNGITIRCFEDNSKVEIGEDCMFSADIEIECTDTHAVFDIDTKELLNAGKFVKIGNHVWVGAHTSILKNTEIPNNCIIGRQSLVTKNFKEENCLIAGIPAQIKKRKVNWSRLRPKQYLSQK